MFIPTESVLGFILFWYLTVYTGTSIGMEEIHVDSNICTYWRLFPDLYYCFWYEGIFQRVTTPKELVDYDQIGKANSVGEFQNSQNFACYGHSSKKNAVCFVLFVCFLFLFFCFFYQVSYSVLELGWETGYYDTIKPRNFGEVGGLTSNSLRGGGIWIFSGTTVIKNMSVTKIILSSSLYCKVTINLIK